MQPITVQIPMGHGSEYCQTWLRLTLESEAIRMLHRPAKQEFAPCRVRPCARRIGHSYPFGDLSWGEWDTLRIGVLSRMPSGEPGSPGGDTVQAIDRLGQSRSVDVSDERRYGCGKH